MTATSGGNVRLRAARRERGLTSQADFVGALTAKAAELGLGKLSVTTRTVRRWESDKPGWPHRPHIDALEGLFGLPIVDLGFTPRAGHPPTPESVRDSQREPALPPPPEAPTPPQRFHELVSGRAAGRYAELTAIYCEMYWHVPAKLLQQAVFRHAELGTALLSAAGADASELARAVSLAWMLAGRVLLFDVHQPKDSRACFAEALECAHVGDDAARGAAALGHLALVALRDTDDSTQASEIVRNARSFSRRGGDPSRLVAWLDTIEADIASRAGDQRQAAALIAHAEQVFRGSDIDPDWLDWFTAHRMATAKANTLLAAGRLSDARMALERAINELSPTDLKARALTLCDLAAVHALGREPEPAVELLTAALAVLGTATSSALSRRVHSVRAMLDEWRDSAAVQALDERLSRWDTALAAISA